eukprot:5959711-Amphidinium_carterae.1
MSYEACLTAEIHNSSTGHNLSQPYRQSLAQLKPCNFNLNTLEPHLNTNLASISIQLNLHMGTSKLKRKPGTKRYAKYNI